MDGSRFFVGDAPALIEQPTERAVKRGLVVGFEKKQASIIHGAY